MSIFESALDAHKSGRLDEASSVYRQILTHEPRHADAFHMLGLIELERGELVAAENSIRQAISINENAIYLTNLSNVLLDQQRMTDAEALLRRAIALNPLYAVAHYNLGLLLMEIGASQEAQVSMRCALELHPEFTEAHVSLGALLTDAGQFSEAEAALRRGLAFDEMHASTHRHLGRLMLLDKRPEEAELFFRRAIGLDARSALAYSGLAAALTECKRLEEAETACRQALAIDSACVDAHVNLGTVLLRARQSEAAEASLRCAIRLDPEHALAHYNLGMVLASEQPAVARMLLERAHELAPSHIETCHALGYVHALQNQNASAEKWFRYVLAHKPSNIATQWCLSLVLLSEGRFEEGWRLHESRTVVVDSEAVSIPPDVDFPSWQGEPLHGKTLVVLHEQGYGDSLQFCRYLPMLKRLGVKRLSVICRSALRPLIESMEGVDVCIEQDFAHDVPEHDYWCFMMSLPLRFNTTIDKIPAVTPYLRAPEERRDFWQRRLPTGGFRVGLVWAGDPRPGMPGANAIDRRRSLNAQAFLPLLAVPDITFVSLQLGAITRPQLESIPPAIRPLDPMGDVSDFGDTAAIIECLDLVIAVDTSTAHLAGALNKPVWILSRFDTCWRWLRGRTDSPWYPSARLFIQETPGDWDGVISRVVDALRERAAT
ncbi:tetratricopeptide repeat protein [Paraburkholderia terrae]|uniref:tetratricopeptide repeat protein n=1 Tax=Paraburkholderia terrae TaxID=311230 RepID=UPI00296AC088|nr:tetratricopeptide repeat protein [Paraburkholderia terrae]MDW3659158.1 tetratricopeptide repeat protein [Paraburkholderia terrae]